MSRLSLLSAIVLASRVAIADPHPVELHLAQVPVPCRQFTERLADARDDVFAWSQQLSLAACLQDATEETARDADELDALFEKLSERLVPTILVDIDVLERAPTTFQIHAAFQVAMAEMSLIVRMRDSIADPASPLHARVESMLDHTRSTIWLAYALIDRAAAREPAAAADRVTAYEVREAREMLAQLPPPPRDELERDLDSLHGMTTSLP